MRRFKSKSSQEDITGEMSWDTREARALTDELERSGARPVPESHGVTLHLTFEEADMLAVLMRGMLLSGDRDERAASVLEKLRGVR